jgi:methylphosphotriester-DNA--protein-cysteine methyltransferase
MRFEYLEAVYDPKGAALAAEERGESEPELTFTAWLNAYGAQRWELLHVLTGDYQTLRCLFKRPHLVTPAQRAAATRATKAAARATKEERIASRRQRLAAKTPTRKR